MIEALIGWSLMGLGVALVIAGVVGVFRFPDIYGRIKAMSVINGLGATLVHLSGVFLIPSGSGYRGLLIAILFLLSSPALAQVTIHAARQMGEKVKMERDDLAEHEQRSGKSA